MYKPNIKIMLNFIYNFLIFIIINNCLPNCFCTFILYLTKICHMKKFFTLLMAVLSVVVASYGQITITEISYNPPESGTDSLEYLEIYNAGLTDVSLNGYKFSKGIDFTFPDTVLSSTKYLLIVKNSKAFNAVYNKTALEWSPTNAISTTNTLTNSGEILEIVNAAGEIKLSFKYEKVAPWPTGAEGTDGQGASIELCMPTADPSVGSNWRASTNDLGFEWNGKKVYGTPGATNSITECVALADYTVEVSSNVFTPKDITINVGETVRWINKGGGHNVNGTVATFPNNPEGFGNAVSSSAWTYDFKFTKAGLYHYQCDPHASLGMVGTVTVVAPVVVDNYPLRTIAQLKGINAEGVADSLNVKCAVKGIVYGINFRPAGVQFTIIDNQNNGFGVFNSTSNLGYTVKEGDEVLVKGLVGQFRGLSQMVADSIKVLTAGNTLLNPKHITEFSEANESSYVQLKNVSFTDPSQWTGTGSGFNMTMTDGTNNYTVRIVNATDAYAKSIPAGTKFNVKGILTQFAPSTTAPFSGGYQLQPNYYTDFEAASGSENFNFDTNIKVRPNPTNGSLEIIMAEPGEFIELYNLQGQKLISSLYNSKLDLSPYDNGMYVIKVLKGNKVSVTKALKM